MPNYDSVAHVGVKIALTDLKQKLHRARISNLNSLFERITIVTNILAETISRISFSVQIPNSNLYTFTFAEGLFQDEIYAYDLGEPRIQEFIKAESGIAELELGERRSGPVSGERIPRKVSYQFANAIGRRIFESLLIDSRMSTPNAQYILANSLFILGTVLCYGTDMIPESLRKVDNLLIVCRPILQRTSSRFECDIHITEKIFISAIDTMPIVPPHLRHAEGGGPAAPAPRMHSPRRTSISRTLRHTLEKLHTDIREEIPDILSESLTPVYTFTLTEFVNALEKLNSGIDIETALRSAFSLESEESFQRFIKMGGDGVWSHKNTETPSPSAFFTHPSLLDKYGKPLLFCANICLDYSAGTMVLLSEIRKNIWAKKLFIPHVFCLISFGMELQDTPPSDEINYFLQPHVRAKQIITLQNDGTTQYFNAATYFSTQNKHHKQPSQIIKLNNIKFGNAIPVMVEVVLSQRTPLQMRH